jgi:hypothetical protein
VSGHFLKSRVSSIHLIVPIKTAIHPVKPIKPGTTMGKPLLSHWRSTSTTKGKAWSVAPLRLKTATSNKLVLITRWRTSNKLNTTRLKVPTICSTTERAEPSSITATETKLFSTLPSNERVGGPQPANLPSPEALLSIHVETVCTTPFPLSNGIRGSGTP